MAIPLSCFILVLQKEHHVFDILVSISEILVPTTITFSGTLIYELILDKRNEHPNLYLAVLLSFFYQMLLYISMKTSLLFDKLSHEIYYVLMALETTIIIFVLILGAQVERVKNQKNDNKDTNATNVSG